MKCGLTSSGDAGFLNRCSLDQPSPDEIDLRKLMWRAMVSATEGGGYGKVLFYGIGNESRQDDALGPKVIGHLERRGRPQGVDVDCNYQLNAEDALRISEYHTVFFVDASREPTSHDLVGDADHPAQQDSTESFVLRPLNSAHELTFTTHAMSPAVVLALCEQIYHCRPHSYLLTIRGEGWDFGAELTSGARKRLDRTLACLDNLLDGYLPSSFDPGDLADPKG